MHAGAALLRFAAMRLRFGPGRATTARARVTIGAVLAAALLAACSSPTVPTIPPTQAPGSTVVPTQSSGPGSSVGPTATPGVGATPTPGLGPTPTPSASFGRSSPCRLLTTDEVNASVGAGFQNGAVQGTSCLFNGSGVGTSASLVSVSVVAGDVITPIRSRYPDLVDLTLDSGVAEWSPSIGTCWLVVDGPMTVIVSILGTSLPDGQLQTVALQLAQQAAGRI